MARVVSLLRYAWISNNRALREASGAEKAAQFVFAVVLLLAFGRFFEIAVVSRSRGPHESIIFALIVCWFLIPLAVEVTMPAHKLATYPLTRLQSTKYLLFSRWMDWKIIILFVASALELCGSAMLGATFAIRTFCILIVTIACGTTLACLWEGLGQHGGGSRKNMATRTRWLPLLRKEVFYLAHTINPYFALAFSTALGYSEIHEPWISPQKATALFVVVSCCHLGPVLNPFAIDSNPERERYMYLPLNFPELLQYKQAASAIMFATSVAPLLIALLWQLTLLGIVVVLLHFGLVTFNLLLTGLVLMRTDSAHSIRIRFWALRSNSSIIVLAFIALVLNAAVPTVTVLITTGTPLPVKVLGSAGVLILQMTLFVMLCRRQTWTSFQNTIAL